ncbi:MAG TPA: hypothetical protein VGK87_09155 [Anaerolineae bacterium]|jgi:hypothetical protein
MAQTKEEFAALDSLTARIEGKLRSGQDVSIQDAMEMNTPFPYGKTGRTKRLSTDDVVRAHIQAHINEKK